MQQMYQITFAAEDPKTAAKIALKIRAKYPGSNPELCYLEETGRTVEIDLVDFENRPSSSHKPAEHDIFVDALTHRHCRVIDKDAAPGLGRVAHARIAPHFLAKSHLTYPSQHKAFDWAVQIVCRNKTLLEAAKGKTGSDIAAPIETPEVTANVIEYATTEYQPSGLHLKHISIFDMMNAVSADNGSWVIPDGRKIQFCVKL